MSGEWRVSSGLPAPSGDDPEVRLFSVGEHHLDCGRQRPEPRDRSTLGRMFSIMETRSSH